jgi:hypothetical protein
MDMHVFDLKVSGAPRALDENLEAQLAELVPADRPVTVQSVGDAEAVEFADQIRAFLARSGRPVEETIRPLVQPLYGQELVQHLHLTQVSVGYLAD